MKSKNPIFISSVAVPIIEMLCNYCESSYMGKEIRYVLYAFYAENVNEIKLSEFTDFLNTTQDKDIIIKYFHRIFTISDKNILDIANKGKKTSSDKRLRFITQSQKSNGETFTTEDFGEILKQFLGYIDKCNVTIIDLSAIPFEVLSIVVSLLSRIIFDFAFHYSKIRHSSGLVNDIPFMLVCEEAHNYIPKNGGAEYAASKHSIERIAKEGRKYGLNLMVVSQRPSEVSDTIFSQCNNFIVLKLTNVNDQSYIKNLLPDNNASLVDVLPTLAAGECLVVGDAVPLPAVVKMDMPNPIPNSSNVNVYPVEQLISLAAKTTCKDRWRQIINEADRLRDRTKFLCTLQQGISTAQLDEMQEERVILVVPRPFIAT